MKSTLIVSAVVVGLAALLAVPSAQANPKKSGGHHWSLEKTFFHKAHAIFEHQDELGLSEQELDAIGALKLETKKALVRQDAEIELVSIDLKVLLREDAVDTEAAKALVDQKYALKAAKAQLLIDAYAKLKGSLSAKQLDTLRSLRKESSHKGHTYREGS